MKKLINFLLIMLMAMVAQQAEAVKFLVKLDSTSGITARGKAANTSYIIGGGDISLSAGLNEVKVTANYFGVKGAYKMYVNGTQITQTNSGYVNFKTDGNKDGDLIEIYQSSSSYPYTYPLACSFTDPNSPSHITSITTNKGQNITSNILATTNLNLQYGETVTVNTNAEAASCKLNGSDLSYNGAGYVFTPQVTLYAHSQSLMRMTTKTSTLPSTPTTATASSVTPSTAAQSPPALPPSRPVTKSRYTPNTSPTSAPAMPPCRSSRRTSAVSARATKARSPLPARM